MSKEPSYHTNPMSIHVSDFNGSGGANERDATLRISSYANRPLSMDELKVYRQSIGGTAVEAALYHSPTGNGTLKTMMMGWGGNFRAPVARLEMAEVARQNPGTDILILNNPGSGASDNISKNAMKQMQRTGSFDAYSEITSGVIKPFAKQYDHVNMYGHSMGARNTIAAAGKLDLPVDYISVTDPPGSRRMSIPELTKGFVVKEGQHQAEYKKRTDNKLSLRLQNGYDQNFETAKEQSETVQYQLQKYLGLIQQAKTMAPAGLKGDLEQMASSGNVKSAQINSPEFSELNRPEDMRRLIANLALTFPDVHFRQVLLRDQTHSVNAGGTTHTTGMLSKLVG